MKQITVIIPTEIVMIKIKCTTCESVTEHRVTFEKATLAQVYSHGLCTQCAKRGTFLCSFTEWNSQFDTYPKNTFVRDMLDEKEHQITNEQIEQNNENQLKFFES